jgi:hypothetical protein
MGDAKVGGSWQESVDHHMVMTRGNGMSMRWMTEGGGQTKDRTEDFRKVEK